MFAQGLGSLLVPVSGEIVEDDYGAGRDLGDQDVADVCSEGGAIHCSLEDPWRNQCILGQPRDQGLRPPASKRSVHRQPLAPLCPSTQAGQVGFHCRFINEDNPLR